MSGPIDALAHDHRELSALLLAVRDALARVERGESTLEDELDELRDGVESFREALLDHFAREQEGLLPFVVARLPSVGVRVDELVAEHDRISELLGQLVRDVHAVDPRGNASAFRVSLAGFEELYAAHSKAELGFLDEVAAAIANDAPATERLRALLEEH